MTQGFKKQFVRHRPLTPCTSVSFAIGVTLGAFVFLYIFGFSSYIYRGPNPLLTRKLQREYESLNTLVTYLVLTKESIFLGFPFFPEYMANGWYS